jgi:PAS domain S-box-containing protein
MCPPAQHEKGTRLGASSETGPYAKDLQALLAANAELQARLEETEETLAAIRSGDVDGLVVGDDLYILNSANIAATQLRNDVLAQMEDAVLAFDDQDHVIFMNEAAERQYETNASDALGNSRSALYQEEWPNVDDRKLAGERLQTTGACRAHTIHVRKDGNVMHVESTVSLLRDAHGVKVGYLAVIRDISQRIRVEETLRAATLSLRNADRRKDEFIAVLAHELRNPLAPILNALQIMQLTTEPAAHETARQIIQRQLGQMVHLVDDLLDVSRISQGKIELRRGNVDVTEAVQNAIETSRPFIDGGKHELVVDLPAPQTLIVNADLTRLCQIIANLLNNAAKYTPAGGSIAISAERDGDSAIIVVRDSGIGIRPEMLPRIFDLFAQADRSKGHSQGGLGIGLALVKNLVEMHGGHVQAHSEGPGCGSKFIVRIPAVAAAASALGAVPTQTLHAGSGSGFRVLVVDDNVDSAETLSQVLQIMGYQTRTEKDGESAVLAAESFLPRVVFLDIGLPKLSGIEAAKLIRQQAGGKEILLVALSGWGQEADRQKSKEAGFDYHFVKPANIEVLIDLLEQVRPR